MPDRRRTYSIHCSIDGKPLGLETSGDLWRKWRKSGVYFWFAITQNRAIARASLELCGVKKAFLGDIDVVEFGVVGRVDAGQVACHQEPRTSVSRVVHFRSKLPIARLRRPERKAQQVAIGETS